MSCQLFVMTYLRFAFPGDLAGAWSKFGGISAQLAHIGTLQSIAAAENAMTAMAYCRDIRKAIATQSRKRISDEQAAKLTIMLAEERYTTKRAAVRDIAATSPERQNDYVIAKIPTKGDPSRRRFVKTNGKGRKTQRVCQKGGQNKKGKGRTHPHSGIGLQD